MGFGRFLIMDPDGQGDSAIRECVQTVCCIRVFLGETEGPFLGADLRSELPGAQAGSRRLRAAGVDALTLPSTRQRLGEQADRGDQLTAADCDSSRSIRLWKWFTKSGS